MKRQTALDLDLLPTLREAERAMSSARPGPELKQKILAEVDRGAKGKAQRRPLSILAFACGAAAAVAFVVLCVEDGGNQKSASSKPPENAAEPLAPPSEDPAPEASASAVPGEKEPPLEIGPVPEMAPRPAPPVSTQISPPRTILHAPAPLAPDDHTPAPIRQERPRIPEPPHHILHQPAPSPLGSVRPQESLFSPWTSAPLAPSRLGSDPAAGLGMTGELAPSHDTPQTPRMIYTPRPAEKPPKKPTLDDEGAEVHVIGLYEGDAGAAKVHLARPGPAILVLSAYSATTWTVTVAPEVELRAVLLLGYEDQTLKIGFEVMVLESTYEKNGEFLGCGYEWPDKDPYSGCETGELLAGLQEVFGLSVSSFSGCYAGSSITLGEDGATGVCAGGYPFSGFP